MESNEKSFPNVYFSFLVAHPLRSPHFRILVSVFTQDRAFAAAVLQGS